MNIHEKLCLVRRAVPYLKKENKGYQFNFVSSSQVLASIRAAMDEVGLLVYPSITKRKLRETKNAKGGREWLTELWLAFTIVNAEKPSECLTFQWYAQGVDNSEKGVGKALTYGEKYFFLKLFNVPTDMDDPDRFQERVDGRAKSVQKLVSISGGDEGDKEVANIKGAQEAESVEFYKEKMKHISLDSSIPESIRNAAADSLKSGALTISRARRVVDAAARSRKGKRHG